MSKVALLVLFLGVFAVASGQADTTIRIAAASQRLSDSVVELRVRIKIPTGVRVYTLRNGLDTTLCSALSFELPRTVRADGAPAESGRIASSIDNSVGGPVRFATDSLQWSQRFVIRDSGQVTIKTRIIWFYLQKGAYLSGDSTFKTFIVPAVALAGGSGSALAGAGGSVLAGAGSSALAGRSLWWIFLAAFGGGLLALLTPCVYSMIPITVSFFTKRSRTRTEGHRNAIAYAASIVIIFTVIGFGVTLLFGPAALNNLATNWIANLVFFALFVAFGLSFLGAFEIALPGSWSNLSDAKAGMGSFSGIFFMALTLAIVSFSCTGPIIGNLLVLAARGSYYGPLVGMFGFSLALALPFALFAFFPSKLNVLGKAGGWLNAVKVTLGFLELALALKFFSNADLARGWRLLDREIFLCLWIVLFLLLGGYLLGKLKLRHDDELPKNDFGVPHVSVLRLLFAIVALAFSVYLIPGLLGCAAERRQCFPAADGNAGFQCFCGWFFGGWLLRGWLFRGWVFGGRLLRGWLFLGWLFGGGLWWVRRFEAGEVCCPDENV
ncbi:MAG TPA: cytochrome c biogenesis protein CcdA [Puia sp.]|nr:cytochrome c biogenesis protein CcdA [Puia sp.]